MIEFPFIGGTYPEDDLTYSPQRTVNLVPEADPNYKSQKVLGGFPGYTRVTRCGNGPIRGALPFGDELIVVSGNTIYKVSTGFAATPIGTIGTSSGRVSMDENGVQVMIVDGQDGWIWNGVTLTKIIDETFTATGADSVTHMDSFFVVNQPGTGTIWASDSFDGTSWNALRTANAEFKSDPIVLVKADRELYLGGTFTTQAYYNSGASPMPFEAIRSSRLVYGVAAKDSWVLIGNTSYFLAQDANGGVFVGRLNGSSVERVSTRAWERVWAGYDYSDAYAMGIHYRGQEWYVLTFPESDHGFGRTFLYVVSTGDWVELGVYKPSVGDFGKWPALVHAYFGGKNLVGVGDGWLCELDHTVHTFDGNTMISLRRSPVLHDKREKLSIRNFTVDMETGNETPSVPDPQMIMRHSKDGGHTWKNTRYASTSNDATNKRKHEVSFRQLGQGRDWVFEVSISDDVSRKFMGGYVS